MLPSNRSYPFIKLPNNILEYTLQPLTSFLKRGVVSLFRLQIYAIDLFKMAGLRLNTAFLPKINAKSLSQ